MVREGGKGGEQEGKHGGATSVKKNPFFHREEKGERVSRRQHGPAQLRQELDSLDRRRGSRRKEEEEYDRRKRPKKWRMEDRARTCQ